MMKRGLVRYYSKDEKPSHLREFIDAIEALLLSPALPEYFAHATVRYADDLETGRHLLHEGFSQDQLTTLGRSFKRVIYTYRGWTPPLVQAEDGTWGVKEWFTDLDERHERAVHAAHERLHIGER